MTSIVKVGFNDLGYGVRLVQPGSRLHRDSVEA